MWERVWSEVEMIPNAEALKLHWLRCCWVMQYWKQRNTNFMSLPEINSFGWNISNGEITVVWDTEINLKKVNDTIQWYTKGCSCKSGCTTLRCSCKKSANKYCSPGCKCVNCLNLPTNLNQVVDDPDSDLEDSEQEDISYESDSETDINEFAAEYIWKYINCLHKLLGYPKSLEPKFGPAFKSQTCWCTGKVFRFSWCEYRQTSGGHAEQAATGNDRFPPEIVVLQIGGNDLDSKKFDISLYMEKVRLFIGVLQTTYHVKKVVVCEIFPRLSLRGGTCHTVYHHGKYLIDQYFYLGLADHPSVSFWFHKSRLTAQEKLFMSDGVHLNVEGTRRFFKSLRGAVMSVL
ncbi:LIN54 [Mytilus coruscus]|uniref:LIN54 n=1 Tax=Mytilus coruscus TaxID=42192 RepID=A0A6J8ES73_MYTCO|nr:LIN54 [Mytilus coruscus]